MRVTTRTRGLGRLLAALAVLLAGCSATVDVREERTIVPPKTWAEDRNIKPFPLDVAVVVPREVTSAAYRGAPCIAQLEVTYGPELERMIVETLGRVFERVTVVRDTRAAANQYDAVVEIQHPHLFVLDDLDCGGVSLFVDYVLSAVLLWYPTLTQDPPTIRSSLSMQVQVLDGDLEPLVETTAIRGEGTERFPYLDSFTPAAPVVRASATKALAAGVYSLGETLSRAPKLAAYASTASRADVARAAPRVSAPRVAPVSETDIYAIPAWRVAPRERDLAVVIGIEQYQAVPRSDFSARDAELVKAYLLALGFREANVEVVLNERATLSALRRALEAWLPNRVKGDSRVVVYYSGHGAPDPSSGESYLVPFDGDPNYLSTTAYPLKRLYETLGDLPAREVLVVLDSCFSGAGGRSVLARGTRPLVTVSDTGPIPPNMAVLASTQGSQISTYAPARRHGLFTYHFLKALNEGKRDVASIYAALKPAVEDEAKRQNVEQTPSLTPHPDALAGRFVLRP